MVGKNFEICTSEMAESDPMIIHHGWRKAHVEVRQTNLNLQRWRYSRLKWDIDKLISEKWSKYRFKQPKFIVLGSPKKPEKGQKWTYPRQELTMFKSIEI